MAVTGRGVPNEREQTYGFHLHFKMQIQSCVTASAMDLLPASHAFVFCTVCAHFTVYTLAHTGQNDFARCLVGQRL